MMTVVKGLGIGLIGALAVGLIALSVFVRLAASDPAVWNVPVASAEPPKPGPCVRQIVKVPKGARATCLLPGAPDALLTKLDAIALAYPRTTRLAGSAVDGRITWVSRSLIMGFPDYITAEAVQTPDGTRLDILSRQRYGRGDQGVNAARLTKWLAQL